MATKEAISRLRAVSALGLPEIGRSSEDRPIFGRRFGGDGPPLLVLGRHPRRRAGERRRAPRALPAPRARHAAAVAHPRRQPGRSPRRPQELGARCRFEPELPGALVRARPTPPAISRGPRRSPSPRRARSPLWSTTSRATQSGARWPSTRRSPASTTTGRRPTGRQVVSAACGWPARGDIGYPTPGSFGSWLGVDRALPVLTLELPAGPAGRFSRFRRGRSRRRPGLFCVSRRSADTSRRRAVSGYTA